MPVDTTTMEELSILEKLKKEAGNKGLSPHELNKIGAIGTCPKQIKAQIIQLNAWLNAQK